MNARQRLELERLYDGELPAPERAAAERSLADDPGARRYLDLLRRLREVATQHNPAAVASSGRLTIPMPHRPRAQRWRAAMVAGVAALIGWAASRGPEGGAPTPIHLRIAEAVPAPSAGRETGPGPTSEVAWHLWANQSPRRSEPAARALWWSGRSSRRHSNRALEVFTLELVNAPPGAAARLQRVAVARQAAPSAARARADRPDHRTHAAHDTERRT